MKVLTQNDVELAACDVANRILKWHSDGGQARSSTMLRLYGVPRGGIPAVYLVARALHNHFKVAIIQNWATADWIIDDIIDSGATRKRYPKKANFAALYEKPGEWLQFPWECDAEGEDVSASDIPLRLLQFMGEDPQREGLKETPARYLQAWREFTSGYNVDIKMLFKSFEDGAHNYDEMVVVQNIPVHSQCEHHMVPFFGTATVAYIPNARIIGLSKINRLVYAFARRLQVQERLTTQIADAMDENLKPKGVGVVIKCRHMCVEARGIRQQGSVTVTSALRGAMRHDASARAEFMGIIK